MNYLEIEIYFQENDKLNQLLEYCKVNYFDKLDYYSTIFNNNLLENASECIKVLSELTGIYLALNPILSIAETEKKNRELRYYQTRKEEIAKEDGEKRIVSAILEREASLYVENYRRIRNILEGYVSSCTQGIVACQSVLKFYSKEIELTTK